MKRVMKIVKQMWMHLGTLYKKARTHRAYSYWLVFTLQLESQFVSAASTLVCFWQNFIRPVSLIARIPQNCTNVLTTPNSPWTTFANWQYLPFEHSCTRLWQRQHDLEFKSSIMSFGVFVYIYGWVTFSALLKQSQPEHSPSRLSSSTSPSTFTESVGMSTTRWVSATTQD